MTESTPQNVQADRGKRITIANVSDALGVTKSTVSRALNGYPDISESTRKRVERMAQQMGYTPLSHAQAIRTGRTRSLGLVLQTNDYDGSGLFLTDFLAGLSEAASAEGWTLTIATSDSQDGTLAQMQSMIREHKADGFILPRTLLDDPRVTLLRDAGKPFVLFGRTQDDTDCAWFDILGEVAMEQAVLHLTHLGHKNIAFVNGGMEYTYSHLRHQGVLSGLTQSGLELPKSYYSTGAVDDEGGYQLVRQLMTLPNPPTAIVCAVDRAAIGAYRALKELNLVVGRDVSVVSYDGIPEGAYQTPQLSTFSVNHREAGHRLGHMLIARVRGEAPETLRETSLAEYLDRGSVGAPVLTAQELAKTIRELSRTKVYYGRKDQ